MSGEQRGQMLQYQLKPNIVSYPVWIIRGGWPVVGQVALKARQTSAASRIG